MEVRQLIIHLVKDGNERLQHLLVELGHRVYDFSVIGTRRQVARRHLQNEAFEDVAVDFGTVHESHSIRHGLPVKGPIETTLGLVGRVTRILVESIDC